MMIRQMPDCVDLEKRPGIFDSVYESYTRLPRRHSRPFLAIFSATTDKPMTSSPRSSQQTTDPAFIRVLTAPQTTQGARSLSLPNSKEVGAFLWGRPYDVEAARAGRKCPRAAVLERLGRHGL